MPQRYARFSDISMSERILNTAFLLTIGIGYLMALINLYYTDQGRDGKPGLSIDDITIQFHGSNDQTRLGSAVTGIMLPNLKYKSDQEVILRWIQNGADEAGYNDKIAPILNRDCVLCHTPAINPSLPDLTRYPSVSELAHGGGASVPSLVRVSHIHLFGIAFILYLVGKIFILCEINIYLKRVMVLIPFVAMLLDVLSWFITKRFSEFAFLVVFSGALMGISLTMQILLSLHQMWFSRTEIKTAEIKTEVKTKTRIKAQRYR